MKYAQSKDGLVHLINLYGGEHTLCGDAYDISESDGNPEAAWEPIERGPVTCENCAIIIQSCRGVRIKS